MRRGWSLPVRQVTGRRLEWGAAPLGRAAAAGRLWSRGEGQRGLKRRVDEERRREKFEAIEPWVRRRTYQSTAVPRSPWRLERPRDERARSHDGMTPRRRTGEDTFVGVWPLICFWAGPKCWLIRTNFFLQFGKGGRSPVSSLLRSASGQEKQR
jgi:hypothetical protein